MPSPSSRCSARSRSLFVVLAPLDGVSDHIAAGQAVGAPDMDSSTGRRQQRPGHPPRPAARHAVRAALRRVRVRVAVADARRAERRARPCAGCGRAGRWLLSNTGRACSAARRAARDSRRRPARSRGSRVASRSRFQAVISTPAIAGRASSRSPTASAGRRRTPATRPTRELEAALAVARRQDRRRRVGAGASDGSWTERRFVWRATNLVALDVGDARERAGGAPRAAAPAPGPPWPPSSPSWPRSAGFVLARRSTPSGERSRGRPAADAPSRLAHDGLRVQLPGGWASADAATVPGFSRPLGLGNQASGSRGGRAASRDIADAAPGRARAAEAAAGARRPCGLAPGSVAGAIAT